MIEAEWQTEDRSGMQGGALRLCSPFAYYVMTQRGIGASRTSAYYAVAPFVGVLLSWVLFGASPTPVFLVALVLMVLGFRCPSDPVSQRHGVARRVGML